MRAVTAFMKVGQGARACCLGNGGSSQNRAAEAALGGRKSQNYCLDTRAGSGSTIELHAICDDSADNSNQKLREISNLFDDCDAIGSAIRQPSRNAKISISSRR